MIFKTLYGKDRRLSKASNYRIDWDGSSRSKFQKRIKDILHPFWVNHIVFEELPVVGTKLSLDFYNANLNVAIEVQGQQHYRHVEFFHGKSKLKYLQQIKRDLDKIKYCEINDIFFFEIYDDSDISKLIERLKGGDF